MDGKFPYNCDKPFISTFRRRWHLTRRILFITFCVQPLLTKALSHSIRITTALNFVVEGTLFTACPITNLVAVNSSPASTNPTSALAAQSGQYHVIPVSQIQNFQILTTPAEGDRVQGSEGFEAALPSISRLDLDALKAREVAAIRKMKEFDATRGKDVTREAQDIFDWFART